MKAEGTCYVFAPNIVDRSKKPGKRTGNKKTTSMLLKIKPSSHEII